MNKELWKIILTIPASLLLYIPLVLVLFEFDGHLNVTSSWWRFLLSFVFFWGGLTFLILTFHMLVNLGKGTPAPWLPTAELVITGPYAIVRNPMMLSVWSILLGEALYFDSWYILLWMGITIAFGAFYVVKIEEYSMANRFGQPYIMYKMGVGRWLPKTRVLKNLIVRYKK